MPDSYKQSIDKNKIPPGLLESTARKMQRAMESPAEEDPTYSGAFSSKRTSRRNWSYALAAAAAVLVFVFVFPFADQTVILTPLDPGAHQEIVELKDGVLYFGTAGNQKVDISHGFGLPSSTNEWTSSEYREYLGLKDLPGDNIKDYAMTDQTIRIRTKPNGEVVSDELIRDYTGKNGETFTLTISKSQNPDIDNNSSVVADIPVSVEYGEKSGEYHGQFDAGEITCTIETSGMTQEDFVLLLYDLIRQARS